ncbi:MAG TPA: tetratricopeptide repeat protein [Pyrinomonadaceae bacterium]|nr:tetratricopeptide repeat protein [Pyrinomonadaceae bacterium]
MKVRCFKNKFISLLIILFVFAFVFGGNKTFGQDDETRQSSGLPTMIGTRPGNTRGANASLAGTLLIQGLTDETAAPAFTVSVYANGQLLFKQRVKNRGSFSFTGIPERGITLGVEADNLEVGSFPVAQILPSPSSNRQDIILTWSQIGEKIQRRNEVISVNNIYPRNEEAQKLFDKAFANIKENKKDAAIKLLKQLLEKDPKDFVAWTELGNIYFLNEKSADAENAYNQALSLKDSFLPALINFGKFYLSQKKFDQAIEILAKAVTLSPTSSDANHYLGESYLQAKKGSKAVLYLNEAIRLAPIEKAEIHLRLAALYNAAGAKDRAVAEYKQFLQKVPNYPEKASIEKYITENAANQ